MFCHIETSHEPDGGWIAKVPELPGFQIYGYSQGETLATARKLTAMLLDGNDRHEMNDQRILAFYPGRVPDSELIAA
jgi:predicted RNase H-like HicB family nuclease